MIETLKAIDAHFVIVMEDSKISFGVPPVRPGGIILFNGLSSETLNFKDDVNPFTSTLGTPEQADPRNVGFQVRSDFEGSVPFYIGAPGGDTWPYRITAIYGGQKTASFKVDSSDAHVEITAKVPPTQPLIRVLFTKEQCIDLDIQVDIAFTNYSCLIPAGQTSGVWDLPRNKYRFKASVYSDQTPATALGMGGPMQAEEVGEDDGELNIDPPPNPPPGIFEQG